MTRPAHARAREERTCANPLCRCGCGESLEGRRTNVHYVDRTHQQRAYRAKIKAEAEAKGIPGSLSLRTVRAQHPTGNRHIDGQNGRTGAQRARKRARRTPDLRISYRKTVDAVADALEEVGFLLEPSGPHDMRDMAEAWLRPLLTERQRAALDQREVRT